jgi:hypothetical protein
MVDLSKNNIILISVCSAVGFIVGSLFIRNKYRKHRVKQKVRGHMSPSEALAISKAIDSNEDIYINKGDNNTKNLAKKIEPSDQLDDILSRMKSSNPPNNFQNSSKERVSTPGSSIGSKGGKSKKVFKGIKNKTRK